MMLTFVGVGAGMIYVDCGNADGIHYAGMD
jgi:hypothetical protein